MLDILVATLSWVLLISGGFFLFVGSLGMIRLQDFWARLHAASIVDSAGVGLIIFGLMLQTGLTLVTVKFAIIIIFLFLTGPTASHAVANAAFVSGSRPCDMIEDETAPKPKRKAASRKSSSEKPANKKSGER